MNNDSFINKTVMHPFIGRLQTAAKSPTAVAVLIFVLFVFANTLKTACFTCFLLDATKAPVGQTVFIHFVRNFLPLAFVFVFLTRPRRWYWFVLFYLVQAFYMTLNLIYHFSLGDFLRFSQFIGLQSEAIDLAKYTDIPLDARLWIVAADLPFVIALLVVYARFSNANKRMFFKPTLALGVLIMVAALFLWNPLSPSPRQSTHTSLYSDASMVEKYGLLAFNINDILNYQKTKAQTLSLRAGPEVSGPGADGPHPDFFLLQVESMGAYGIHREYHGAHVAPFLHNLVTKSIYFPYAFSYHEAGLTTDCEFSVINSIEPLGDFPTMRLKNYRYLNSMYKRLGKYDYSVVAFHGNQGHFDNRDETYGKIGVQTFWDLTRMGLKEISWGAPDGDVFNFVEGQLGTQHEPFLYHIITMSSHEPFTLVNPYYKDNRFNSMPDKHAMAYLKSIAYVDREMEKFVTFIRKARPNCYIFIYGDHTPIGNFREFKKASYTSEGKLFEFVPLFILTPDSRVHYETRCVASFIDVAPTVLAASGVPYRIHTKGTNLLNVPLEDGPLPFRGGTYLRSELYAKIKQEFSNR